MTEELKNRGTAKPSGEHIRQLFDSPSLEPRRGIAADAGIAIQSGIVEIGGHVQSGMRLALHGQQFIAGTQVLFKNRYAERVPEQVAIVIGETCLVPIGKYDHGMTEFDAVPGEPPQLFGWGCQGGRLEACRPIGPTGRKDANQLGFLKTRR